MGAGPGRTGRTPSAEPSLGDLVRTHRQNAGLAQETLALRAGVSIRTVSNIERGSVARPRAESVRRLLTALGLGADDSVRPAEIEPVQAGRPALAVRVLGPLSVERHGRAIPLHSARLRSLLGRLAVQHGQPVGREEIAEALWGSRPPRTYPALVNSYVARLRDVLEPDRAARSQLGVVVLTTGGYRLDLREDQLDVARFERLADRGRHARGAGDLGAAQELFEQALAIWRGPVLADLRNPLSTQHPSAVALGQLRLDTAVAYADASLTLGRHEAVVRTLRALADEEPLHEGLAARLMLALAATGRQAEALDLFFALRTRLGNELGIEPGTELTDAHLRVLRQQTMTPRADDEPARAVPRQLPAGTVAFHGRAEHLSRLDDLLDGLEADPRPDAAVAVVAGTAGVGKTTLAVHWARRQAHRFPHGQLYVNLQGYDRSGVPVQPAEAIRHFLDALGVPPERIPERLPAQAALYRSILADRRMLVLLDNARDVTQVRELLPGSADCLTIVTSRDRLACLVADGALPISVDLLPVGEAVELLARRIGGQRVGAEPDAVEEIVRRCSRLPLALAIVAARAATHPGFALAELSDELTEASAALDVLNTGDLGVRAAFSWSYRALTPAAARLFRLLGLHPGPDIAMPAAASLAAVTAAGARQLLAELTRANLITEHSLGRFACHDLLRAYAGERGRREDSDEERSAAVRRLDDHYLRTAHAAARLLNPARPAIRLPARQAYDGVTLAELADHGQALRWFTTEHQVLMTITKQPADLELRRDRHVWQLAWCLVDFFDRQGHWRDWITTHTAALAAARSLASDAAQAHIHRGLGLAHARLRWDGAEEHLHRALELFEALDDGGGRAAVHHDLARILEHAGHHTDAVEQAWKALRIYQSLGDLGGQGKVLNGIGWHYALVGEHHTALRHCERARDLLEQAGSRIVLAATWDSLGYISHHLGDYHNAVNYYAQALDTFAEFGERALQGEVLLHLGDTQAAVGDIDAALEAWGGAQSILEKLGVPDADQARARIDASLADRVSSGSRS
ncbi:BTAD domain-containing putative transcriptional regulator [Cryptosporangium aurantiacum]|uniref:DNA-binding transcriptional activator of the SARP family n=1 Tax=Cryptosporangium aurantiacum TaxID=134849 RepID=A0A1M7RMU0_9ACTN|nr:BTAD domain-containing putative transcriptional regulator [Cryptosporangium aurantiacum]SHN47623.1 DNA-binding transcriptional activator of the SARP family [Cryptosporangium aurantiacum]